MLKRMSLRIKLFLLITLVVILTFGIVTTLVSTRSSEMAKADAFALADEMSAKYSHEIKAELQAARVTSESLMTVFKTLIERGDADRDTLNAILQKSLLQKEYIISFCVAFEPNKLDGKDAEFAGQYPLYGETGRYAPYWSLQDGEIGVEPLENFDNDVWYAGARDSGKEYITDPFFYEVQGTSVLMTSLVFPILIDGEFIGIVSSDMALDSLQEMVSHVNTSGLDEYTEIYSNSGLVVAHPDDTYFNKSVFATSVYNMLLSDPSKAQEALEITTNYANRYANDESQAEEHEGAIAFARSLTSYSEKQSESDLDLTLLSNGLAKELLQLDSGRLRIAEEATKSIEEGELYTVSEDGYYKVYMPIQFSEATNPWSVAVNVPMSEVLQKSNGIRNYVILISVIGSAIIAILLYIVTRNLTNPILKLAGYAKQVGDGNFSIEIPETRNSDEIGILSKAFRTMVAQINDLVNKLTSNSEELERKNEHLGELNVMLTEARDQAEASNRAKTVFLSNMSHEMRTPLNAIVGMTSIGKRAREEEKKNDAFRKIEDASAHLLLQINDVLDMSKMEANTMKLSPADFSFQNMLDSSVDLLRAQIKAKGHALAIEVDEGIPATLIGDKLRLSQVVINLLSNAVKFTQERGKIGLRAFVKEKADNWYVLQVEVSDTGIGISQEQQGKLFRLFEQADNSASRSFGGTGLGLALSKRIVGLMGGEIWVESVPGQGSTFFFTVKLERGLDGDDPSWRDDRSSRAPDRAAHQEEPAEPGGEADFRGKRILLAEDIEINREIVLGMLEATNAEIDCAVNGKEACEMVAANPGKYDLILMDIQMPVMDGVEAAKQIRTQDPNVPIIALTANVFQEDVDQYLAIGMNSHIGKPLDYQQTMEMLSEYLK